MRNRSKLLAFAIALSSVAGQGVPVLANESDVTIEPADQPKVEEVNLEKPEQQAEEKAE